MRVRVGLFLCIGWLSPLFEFMNQWLETTAGGIIVVYWMAVSSL